MLTAADTQLNKVSEDFLITKNKKYLKNDFPGLQSAGY